MKNTIEEKIENILRVHPKSKDSDNELFLAWAYYEGQMTEEEKIAFAVFKEVMRRLPPLESLSRARRRLQQDNPYLRGTTYVHRQLKEKKVRKYYREN